VYSHKKASRLRRPFTFVNDCPLGSKWPSRSGKNCPLSSHWTVDFEPGSLDIKNIENVFFFNAVVMGVQIQVERPSTFISIQFGRISSFTAHFQFCSIIIKMQVRLSIASSLDNHSNCSVGQFTVRKNLIIWTNGQNTCGIKRQEVLTSLSFLALAPWWCHFKFCIFSD